ncbi:MAG TPA: 2-oxoglutarate dehydrogenase complex dihydrolipoyllysine-residue succinyltransferase [Candidatus Krumholzibacteria bacterium]|nr:2-oxoglutarate dehydrogenase complex dihydrolipoyllysine-residue succinyltransferase [Candidatus Krumholzibacteria bacterium]HRX49988.1 2-oxoglutarate dehydrogenase complex dihydrolipoyllysine-residue succinyltransferase [Candidatus Krumholzibacteria bacterium]
MKPVDVKVPDLGESITTVMVSAWLKKPGDAVALDEPVVELESDKATVEVPAPAAGVLQEIAVQEGEEASTGDLLGRIDADGEAAAATDAAPTAATDAPAAAGHVMPAARRVLDEAGLSAGDVKGSGPGGRVLKEDAAQAAAGRSKPAPAASKPAPAATPKASPAPRPAPVPGSREVRETPMSPIRRTIARRLVQSQHEAALLTTFNEVDMTRVKAMRAQFQDAFVKKHGVKLGFMSFFVRAVVEALEEVPALNAQIRDDKTIVQHEYCDIGIAVGGGKGLVVPVIRNAEGLEFGAMEQTIADFAERAAANRIELEELEGGTFTISNGGVYGSLLSTPIVNPPQSGVLGLHGIQDRPVALDGQVVIRPMMYIALTYDHRLVDGREAVTFLKHIKNVVEAPERLLLKI